MAGLFMDGTIGTCLVQMAVQLAGCLPQLALHFEIFSSVVAAEVCMSDNRMAPLECSKVGPGLTYSSLTLSVSCVAPRLLIECSGVENTKGLRFGPVLHCNIFQQG